MNRRRAAACTGLMLAPALLPGLLAQPPVKGPDMHQTPTSASGTAAGGAAPAATSPAAALARRVQALPQAELPDAWYPATDPTVARRFASTWRAMPPGPNRPPTADALMARYAALGEAFAHTVWLNRPLRCTRCNAGGGDGFTMVVAIRHELMLRISAREMHEALVHDISFPEATQAALSKLFGAPRA